MDMRDTHITLVNTFLIEKLEIDESLIRPEADLKMDLGLTSLDAIELALFIKETFNIPPQMPDIKAIVTLNDLYNYIEQHQNV